MLGQKSKSEQALFAQRILTTFGKLDLCDIASIDGSRERLISHLVQRYEWSDEYAREMTKKSFPDGESPDKPRSRGVGLIGRGIAVLGFITRQPLRYAVWLPGVSSRSRWLPVPMEIPAATSNPMTPSGSQRRWSPSRLANCQRARLH